MDTRSAGRMVQPALQRQSGSVCCPADVPAGAVSSFSMTAPPWSRLLAHRRAPAPAGAQRTPAAAGVRAGGGEGVICTWLRAETPPCRGHGQGPRSCETRRQVPAPPAPRPLPEPPALQQDRSGAIVLLSPLGCPSRRQQEPFVGSRSQPQRGPSRRSVCWAPLHPRCRAQSLKAVHVSQLVGPSTQIPAPKKHGQLTKGF